MSLRYYLLYSTHFFSNNVKLQAIVFKKLFLCFVTATYILFALLYISSLLELKSFLGTLTNVQKVELLPYHSMGEYKWKKLGLKYDLDGIKDATNDNINRAKKILGI